MNTPSDPLAASADACTGEPGTAQAALLGALKAIMAECGRTPGQRPHSLDSYLPAHLLDAAQHAIEAAGFAQLKAEFAQHGHTLTPFGTPASYMAEREGLVRYLHTLADAEAFLAELQGGAL